ncbi:MAG: hypothetical protein B7X04_01105 [Parcubacteria group bacterium 21-54-25]|nr:MAG: hypothetical protein B7X04_01105 [Parcubacteria group bacterium 21-54-25]HQU07831.1 hypothetical protein [Candidatus Paceibacterota bacterium]
MSTTAERIFEPLQTRESLLQNRVKALGVPILPREVVEEHKAHMVQACRPGVFGFIGPAVRGVMWLLVLLAGFLPEIVWRRYRTNEFPQPVLFGSLLLVLVLPPLAAWMVGLPAWPMFFFTLILAQLALYGLFRFVSSRHRTNVSTSYWEAICVTVAGRNATVKVGSLPVIPAKLRRRAERVRTIPGTRLVIERFRDDPLIAVERGRWPFVERVYIGAWDTGCPALDNA